MASYGRIVFCVPYSSSILLWTDGVHRYIWSEREGREETGLMHEADHRSEDMLGARVRGRPYLPLLAPPGTEHISHWSVGIMMVGSSTPLL